MRHAPIERPAEGSPPSERPITPAMIERARAGLAAGEGVEHGVVAAWLRTWGKPGRRRFEDWLAAWNG